MNSSLASEELAQARARTLLFSVLDELDEKYGPKPSLLATRADYVESTEESERLLRTGYAEAERIGDDTNKELIAHSLAEFYIDDARNLERGASWLAVWRDHLGVDADESNRDELGRLEGLLLDGGTA